MPDRSADLFDVIVFGAGAAGCAAAVALHRKGRNVLLVDLYSKEPAKWPLRSRGEILRPGAKNRLLSLSLWKKEFEQSHMPIWRVKSSWGAQRQEGVDFFVQPFGNGLILDGAVFRKQLIKAAEAGGVKVIRDTGLNRCHCDNGVWFLTLSEGNSSSVIAGHTIIDCSGREMVFSDFWNLNRVRYDRLTAYMAVLDAADSTEPEEVKAQIEAVENGWWMSTKIWDNQVLCVFASDFDLVAELGDPPEKIWLSELQKTKYIRQEVKIKQPAKLSVRSSVSSHSSSFSGNGWLLAGESAHSFDFLSGQGIDIAVDSGLDAAGSIERFLNGDVNALTEYGKNREKLIKDYLKTRGDYYSSARCFRHHLFWARRQNLVAGELPLWLEPKEQVVYDEKKKDLLVEAIAESILPLSEYQRLIELNRNFTTASELLEIFRQKSPFTVDDYGSLIAIQTFAGVS